MIDKIITKTWQTFQEYNKTDVAGLFTYPQATWDGFTPLVLFTLFIITALATYHSEKRLTGRADFFSSYAVASFFVAITAIVMTLVQGLIDETTLSVCIVNAVVGFILLFFRNR